MVLQSFCLKTGSEEQETVIFVSLEKNISKAYSQRIFSLGCKGQESYRIDDLQCKFFHHSLSSSGHSKPSIFLYNHDFCSLRKNRGETTISLCATTLVKVVNMIYRILLHFLHRLFVVIKLFLINQASQLEVNSALSIFLLLNSLILFC